MAEANPVGMPLDPNIKIGPNPIHNEPNRSNSYAKLLGELQYPANATRPDISYAVNKLGLYTANPSLEHYRSLKPILRYLAGTRDYGITYRKSNGQNNDSNLFPWPCQKLWTGQRWQRQFISWICRCCLRKCR